MSQIHLFGEMDLDLSDSASDIFKKAFDIAEACGYFVEAFSEHIDVRGEDCHDSIYIIYRLHIENKKIVGITKHIHKAYTDELVKMETVL